MSKEDADALEKMSRTFCYQIYRRRFSILSEFVEDDESETDDDDIFSLHDTTEEDYDSSSDDDIYNYLIVISINKYTLF